MPACIHKMLLVWVFLVSTLPLVADTERVENMHLQQLQQEATSVLQATRNLFGML